MFNIVIRLLHTISSDHPSKPSTHRMPKLSPIIHNIPTSALLSDNSEADDLYLISDLEHSALGAGYSSGTCLSDQQGYKVQAEAVF